MSLKYDIVFLSFISLCLGLVLTEKSAEMIRNVLEI
jgi:hypothetical protein